MTYPVGNDPAETMATWRPCEVAFLAAADRDNPVHDAIFDLLDPTLDEIGMLLCERRGDGAHATALAPDAAFLHLLASGEGSTALDSLHLPLDKFPTFLIGWPHEWVAGQPIRAFDPRIISPRKLTRAEYRRELRRENHGRRSSE
jgi:hypothetical protein